MAKSTATHSHGFIELIKFILFIVMIPVVASVTIAFLKEITELRIIYHQSFRGGVLAYVLLNLFVSDFEWLYRFGQTVASELFKFWDSLTKVMPLVLPVYTIVTVLLYYVIVRKFNIGPNQGWWFFAIGFTFAMHIIMTARELYESDTSFLKPNYFFDMTLIYILDIFLMVQLLNAAAWKFSLVGFAWTVFDLTCEFYQNLYFKFF